MASRINDNISYNAAGGLLHAFNKSTFIEMCGIEERFAHGFAFEDTHFFQYWQNNKKAHLIPFNENGVIHFWHSYEQDMSFNMHLWYTYSEPLCNYMVANNIRSNIDNPNWQRPEMIKDVKIWKD